MERLALCHFLAEVDACKRRVMRACWPGLCSKGIAKDSIFDRHGGTPIIYAAAHGHLSCIKFLLQNNANVNSQDKYVPAVIAICFSGCGLRV